MRNKYPGVCYQCKERVESGDGETCQECCEHDDLDHGICMDCEADLSDELCNIAHEISEGMER